jgi:hypothetical protein
MRKAFRRAAHALAAAGALGLVHPAVAQTAAPAKGAAKAAVKPTDPAAARLAEMRVELALLGDPATFGHTLGCKHTGAGMEVRGFVPDDIVRAQALEIARQHCDVPVVDKLQVNGSLALRTVPAPADELSWSAKALLAEALGRDAAGVEVRAAAGGRVVVSGACGSYEEKLAVSRALRGLRGCCCAVDNFLTVRPVVRGGRLVALVTADGSMTVAASGADAAPVRTVRNPVDPAPAVPPAAPSVPPSKPAATARNDVALPPLPVKNELPPLPAAKAPAVALKSDTAPPSTPAAVAPHFDVLPPPARKADTAPPKIEAAVKCDVPALPPAPAKAEPPAAKKTDVPGPLPPLPGVAMKSDMTAPVPAYKPPVAAPLAPLPDYAKDAPPVPKPNDGVARTNAQVPASPVKTSPPGGGKWPPAHESRPAQAAYATTGVVTFDDDLPEPQPLMKPDKLALLKHRVESVCGPLAKDVVVTATPDGTIQVQVKTATARENEDLTMKILRLPEMAAPNVRLDVRLAK